MALGTPCKIMKRMQSVPGLQDTALSKSRLKTSSNRQGLSASVGPMRSRRLELYANADMHASLLTSSTGTLTGYASASKRTVGASSPLSSCTKEPGSGGLARGAARKIMLGAPRQSPTRPSIGCHANSTASPSPRSKEGKEAGRRRPSMVNASSPSPRSHDAGIKQMKSTSASPRAADGGARRRHAMKAVSASPRAQTSVAQGQAAGRRQQNVSPVQIKGKQVSRQVDLKGVSSRDTFEKGCMASRQDLRSVDVAGPMTAKETLAVASGFVEPHRIFRLRARQPPPLHDLFGPKASLLWQRRQAALQQQALFRHNLCLVLGDDFCCGLSGKVTDMLGAMHAGALACCSAGVRRLVWRTLEPLCSELHSRKTRRAIRAAATAVTAAQHYAAQQALATQKEPPAFDGPKLGSSWLSETSCKSVACTNSPPALLLQIPSPQRSVRCQKASPAMSPRHLDASQRKAGDRDNKHDQFNANAGCGLLHMAFSFSTLSSPVTHAKSKSSGLQRSCTLPGILL
jgi:hypothetical protein